MKEDRLWPGGPRYVQEPGLFPLSSDSAWLGGFVRLTGVRTACDLGCGGGAVALQLLGRKPDLRVTALDILPAAAERTRANGLLNGWEITAICGDLREHRSLLPPGGFDLAASNPPYYSRDGGIAAGSRGLARQESCSPMELCAAAAWLLKQGGRFALVYPPARLSELFCAMTAAGLEPKRLRLVMKTPRTGPAAALVEGIRGGGRGLMIELPLYTEGEAG